MRIKNALRNVLKMAASVIVCLGLSAASVLASCSTDSTAQPASPPYGTGTFGYQANSYYTAGSGFTVNVDSSGNPVSTDNAVVSLRAGTEVCLEPGFHAAATVENGGFLATVGSPLVNTTTSTTSPIPTAVIGTAYSLTLTSTGGTGPYTWTYTGTLPPGLSMISTGTTGEITGTPAAGAAGTYGLSLQVYDAYSILATAVPISITVAAASQTITFNPPGSAAYGAGNVTLVATASSGLPVSFSSNAMTICTVSGNSVTILDIGTCSITANQAGNSSYSAATAVTKTFPTTQASQTITFPPIGNVTYGVGEIPISATASSGLPISFTTTNSSICSPYHDMPPQGWGVLVGNGGTCGITASQAGNHYYQAAPSVTNQFTVARAPATTTLAYSVTGSAFTFTATVSPSNGTGPVYFFITASSVPFAIVTVSSGIAQTACTPTLSSCSVPGYRSLTSGDVAYAIYEPGSTDPRYQAAVSNFVTLSGGTPQTITFSSFPSSATYGSSPIGISASALPSGLTVGFVSTTPPVCTVSGSTVTIVGAGTCSITASQAGNSTYSPAANVTMSVTVGQASQTITFPSPGNPAPNSNIALTATTSSGLGVSYATVSPCTLNGAILTVGGAGTSCTVTASQNGAGSTNYLAATDVTDTVTVSSLPMQTIHFAALPDLNLTATPAALSATAVSTTTGTPTGLPVSFNSLTPPVCTVSGTTIHLVSAGACTIVASQIGNGSYAAAQDVTQSFNVNPPLCVASLHEFIRLGGNVIAIENSCTSY